MHDDVLAFWFEQTAPARWWASDPAFDALIRRRYGALLQQAARGELYAWRTTPHGRLAEVIVLDQFSRNIHRDTPRAFAQDGMALALAQEAVAAGVLTTLEPVQRGFVLMPYMHSESRAIHALAQPPLTGANPAAPGRPVPRLSTDGPGPRCGAGSARSGRSPPCGAARAARCSWARRPRTAAAPVRGWRATRCA